MIEDAAPNTVPSEEAPDQSVGADAADHGALDPVVDPDNVDAAEIEEGETRCSRLCEGLGLVLTAALVALVFTNLSDAISLSGATYCCFISYLLPATLYIVATNDGVDSVEDEAVRRKRNFAIFAICWGVLLAVGGVVTVLM